MKQIRTLYSGIERRDRAVEPGYLSTTVKTPPLTGGYMCILGSIPIGVSIATDTARIDIGVQECLLEGEKGARYIERAERIISLNGARVRTGSQEVRRNIPLILNEKEHGEANRVRAGKGPLHVGAPGEPFFPVAIHAKSPDRRPADKKRTHPSRSDEKVLEG